MNDERHPHICDCDACLNVGGGMVLASAGRATPVRVTTRQATAERLRSQARRARAKARQQRAETGGA